ncbi:hypothetical protein E2C01_059679 [Portunus trituberculatus]|uniref:Uncharacterized protein n=1 Tax=Portunus trituberculatus TaxID=210409 RepID=A0A5B7H388_PORTR|nr:hypothetical protein [Portunus trituberculatus]
MCTWHNKPGGQGRCRVCSTRQGEAAQGQTEQERIREDSSGQGRTGQYMSGQGKGQYGVEAGRRSVQGRCPQCPLPAKLGLYKHQHT